MNRCRCNDIRRANSELSRLTNGQNNISTAMINASRGTTRLSAAANSIFSGVYSGNRDSIADAIEFILTPVIDTIENTMGDIERAKERITNQRTVMQNEDKLYHLQQDDIFKQKQ